MLKSAFYKITGFPLSGGFLWIYFCN